MKRSVLAATFAITTSLFTGLTFADEPTKPVAKKPVYGSQIMTPQERAEHRKKMRATKNTEERQQVRQEHHEQMKESAKEKGVALPENPPPVGGGVGPRGGISAPNK
ncbi:MAG: hypothetical protein Q8O24_03915 [Gallionellaceae bacterium]|nr:hypothetical protein [Gallionellaceae bacterium]